MNPEHSKMIERLYLQMYDMLITYARCSFSEEPLVEEAVQETFRIACQKPDQLCESENPQGWLVNTLKFTILNMKRSRENAQHLLSAFLIEQSEQVTDFEETLPLKTLYGSMADTEEFQLIKEMAVEGRSHLEMAEARGITVSACKKRVQRAKEKLQEKLKQDVTK